MKHLATVFVMVCAAMAARAATLDSDYADLPAYADGIKPGEDGSSEPSFFGGWTMADSVAGGAFSIASSAGLGAGALELDRNSKAFKLHAAGGGYADVFRFIDPLGLETGETFSLDLAVNFRGGYKGFDVRDASEQSLFTFNIGNDDYVISKAATGNGSIGNTYAARTLFSVRFTQDTASGGTWRLVRSGAIAHEVTGTYIGRIRSLKIYSGGQRDIPEDALYFNRLLITSPAP